MNTIRLAFRVYIEKKLYSEERLDVKPEDDIGELIPAFAEKHAAVIAASKGGMVEAEFLDEPNPLTRFFRIGTDPSGMVMPMAIDLTEGMQQYASLSMIGDAMSEGERLVDMPERYMRRVIKATWNGEPWNQYCMQLECGHTMHGSAGYLRAEVLCGACLKQALGTEKTAANPPIGG